MLPSIRIAIREHRYKHTTALYLPALVGCAQSWRIKVGSCLKFLKKLTDFCPHLKSALSVHMILKDCDFDIKCRTICLA